MIVGTFHVGRLTAKVETILPNYYHNADKLHFAPCNEDEDVVIVTRRDHYLALANTQS